ncbi:MAG: hypothetical protein JZU62_04685 [Sulfuricurvum sp.]|uniref:hypothetical protein n=1 Tax=Sulfuricurvum sp. TaxID=2025608 RepID=UPI0025CBF267|nr:hypothetical protein [Sulfuricurvum sp.]MBV5320959.1 hypothetical protein [Sulfuricurvum sp.]
MVTKIILLIGCIALSTSSSAQELEDIFKDGKVSSQLSAFWYDGDRELRIDRTALTLERRVSGA